MRPSRSTRPSSASSIARSRCWVFIRRDVISVRPFSRARLARNDVRPSLGNPDEHDAPADPCDPQRRLEALVLARDLERDVDRLLLLEARGLIPGHEQRLARAGCDRGLDPVRQAVGRDDPASPDRPKRADEQEPHRTAADDRDARAAPDVAQVDRVQRDPERLEESDLVVADRVRDREEQARRPGHPFPKAAVGDRVAQEPDVRTEVPVSGPAGVAMPAGPARLHRDADARARPGRDDAAKLMPEHERLCQRCARPAIHVPVEVGAAEPDGGHPHQLLARSRDGLGHRLETEIADRVQAERVHRGHDSARVPPLDGFARQPSQALSSAPMPALVPASPDRHVAG